MYKSNNVEKATETQNRAIKAGMFLSLPAAFGIILLAEPIIHIIYERGAFTGEDTTKTALAISAFALGLPAFVISKIMTPIFYAHHDTKTPLKITVYSLTLNTVINVILMIPFGHVGIALGSSIASWYNVWLLKVHTNKKHEFSIPLSVITFSFKVLLCCAFMSLVILAIRYNFENYFYDNSALTKVMMLLGSIILGASSFFGLSAILKLHRII
jgi:putative peptidoglycan lipid II flippase